MPIYCRRPNPMDDIEAIQWIGTNYTEIKKTFPDLKMRKYKDIYFTLLIKSKEHGILICLLNDYVVKKNPGDYISFARRTFEELYEEKLTESDASTRS